MLNRFEPSSDRNTTLRSSSWIEGHRNERGSVEYNMALGDNRANAVKQSLITV